MKTIEIEDTVFNSLEKLVRGFGDTPNDVIKRLLVQSPAPQITSANGSSSQPSKKTPIGELTGSLKFLHKDAVGRYLDLLRFLWDTDQKKFEQLVDYRRKGGRRINFAPDSAIIERSGSSTYPQEIPGTGFYVLTNLDNRSKRKILSDIMPRFGFSKEEIRVAIQGIPDSEITRSRY